MVAVPEVLELGVEFEEALLDVGAFGVRGEARRPRTVFGFGIFALPTKCGCLLYGLVSKEEKLVVELGEGKVVEFLNVDGFVKEWTCDKGMRERGGRRCGSTA